MDLLTKITQEDYVLTMKNIIKEDHPTLRMISEEVEIPLMSKMVSLGDKMLNFLKNSQNPEIAEKLELRGGVGLAAPQLDVSKRVVALLVPDSEDAYSIEEVMYNPKIISHSVQEVCLKEGEGCLSVDREVLGAVIRYARVRVAYFNRESEKKELKLKGYDAIVVQHEIDHLNGILFFDRINAKDPWAIPENVNIME
ncbi:MAG: peptide deformylase [Lactobacillales bacterium]|jgi:peptide deformylase|nr:peptide deformylase [Lactobacillales bacterium]